MQCPLAYSDNNSYNKKTPPKKSINYNKRITEGGGYCLYDENALMLVEVNYLSCQ